VCAHSRLASLSERRDLARHDESRLVAAGAARRGEDRAESDAGIPRRPDAGPAGDQHALRADEELLDVLTQERCRNETDERERRIPAADVGGVQKDAPEPALPRD